jgi:hypothetical protein
MHTSPSFSSPSSDDNDKESKDPPEHSLEVLVLCCTLLPVSSIVGNVALNLSVGLRCRSVRFDNQEDYNALEIGTNEEIIESKRAGDGDDMEVDYI